MNQDQNPPSLPSHWQHSYISWVVYLGSIHAKMHWRQEDFNIEDEKKKKKARSFLLHCLWYIDIFFDWHLCPTQEAIFFA